VPFGAKKVPDETRSYQRWSRIATTNVQAYENRAAEFEKARRYSLGLLAADRAVFPSAEFSALTLTCARWCRVRRMIDISESSERRSSFGDGDLAKRARGGGRVDRPDDPLPL